MKKMLTTIAALFLVGCSEPISTVKDTMPLGNLTVEQEQMDEKIHVYSLSQNSEGFVVKWDERDKWAIVPAPVVVEHPKALIETSNGQRLEGTVTSIDTKNHVAVIHFRNSARLENKKMELQAVIKNYNEIVNAYTLNPLNESILDEIMKDKGKEGLTFEERMEARDALKGVTPIVMKEENIIDDYEKQTFTFDRDLLQQNTLNFIDAFNRFVVKDNESFATLFVNDAIQEQLINWESFGEAYQLNDMKVTALTYEGFLYKSIATGHMGKSEEKLSLSIVFTKLNDEFKVVTFSLTN